MTDHEPDDLDRRIRDLIGRAVADTPPTPRLEQGVLVTPTDAPTDRNRWIVGGLAGLSIAAAIVAIFLFSRPDEVADPLVPATQSTTPVTTPPTPPKVTEATTPTETSTPTSSVASSTAPATTAPATTTPATTTPVTATPPTTAAAPKPVDRADVRLQAGPDGVEILGLDGRVVTTEPMAIARLGPNGSVYMQRTQSVDVDSNGSETQLLVVGPNSSAPEPVVLAAPLDGPLRLHDSAAVEGRWTVLVESVPPMCPNPDDCVGGLYLYRPDTGEITELVSKIVWEGGWEQLSLSETGLIVGTESGSASRGPFIAAVPGASVELPTPAGLGLDENYFDCSDCPQGYGINRRGDAVAWVEGDPASAAIVRMVALDGTPIGEAPFAATGDNIVVVSLGDADVGGGNSTPIAIVNAVFVGDRTVANLPVAPVYVDIVTGEVDLGPEGARASYE